MKKMKKLSMLLSAVMLSSAIVIPVHAEEEWTQVYSEDFESYADTETLKSNWKEKNSNYQNGVLALSEDGGANGSKALKFSANGETQFLGPNLETQITSGKVLYKAKFKLEGTNLDNTSAVVGLYQQNKNCVVVRSAAKKLWGNTWWQAKYVFSGWDENTDRNGKWYSLTAELDMDAHTYTAKVTDGVNTYTTTNGVLAAVDSNNYMTEIENVFVQYANSNDSDATVYFDDISISVPATKREWIKEDFTGYTDDAALQAVWKAKYGEAVPVLADDNGSKAMKFTRSSGDSDLVERTTSKVTTGKLDFKAKFKIKYGTDNTMPVLVGMRNNNASQNMNFVYMTNNGLYTNTTWSEGGKKFEGYTANQADDRWYEIRAVVDMDNKKYDVAVTDGTEICVRTEQALNCVGTANAMTDVSSVFIQTWGGENSGAEIYLDSISLTEHDDAFVFDKLDKTDNENAGKIYSENFEKFTSDEELQEQWKDKNGSAAPVLGTDNGSKTLKYTRTSETANMIEHVLSEKITAGKLKFKARFKSEAGDGKQPTLLLGMRNNKATQNMNFVYLTDAVMYTNTTWAGGTQYKQYAGGNREGKWYEVEAVINMDTKKYDASVTDENGTYTVTGCSFNSVGTATAMTDISSIFIQTWGDDTAGAEIYLDDISLEYVLEPIEIEASDIKAVHANGEEKAIASTVSASTSAFKVDLGTALQEATLTNKSVILKNVTDDKNVFYTGKLEGSVYTMTLSKLLEPGKNYKLQFTTDIKTLGGGTLEENKTFSFATDNGECAITLKGIKIGDNVEPTAAEITAASSAAVTVSVLNSTKDDKKMVIVSAYYKGGEMTWVKYTPVSLAKENYENKTFDVTFSLPTDKEADNVKIFAWDTITGMVPYGVNLDI